jgi:putative phosphoribosyl transferase
MTAGPAGVVATAVEVPAGDAILEGELALPERASGVVLFAHGSGSSRHSPRNRQVAGILDQADMGSCSSTC